jgi:hypothetical protein
MDHAITGTPAETSIRAQYLVNAERDPPYRLAEILSTRGMKAFWHGRR